MKNINTLNTPESLKITRVLTLSLVGVISLLMFSLAITASADTLTRELQLGMSGSDVSTLQAFLAKDPTLYPQGLVTGYFGVMTKSAVTNFQARNGISTVGRVGPVTLQAINSQMSSGNTVGYDRVSPSINTVSLSPSNSGATISWNTNENAAGIIYYGISPITFSEGNSNGSINVSGTSLLANTGMQTAHSGTLTGLNSNTTYYYVLYVKDASGNENVTWPATFKTNQ
jgi:peptidoglycan hydrolase-like protein with peptidoglycan-binding domain